MSPKLKKEESLASSGNIILQLDPAVILADDNTRFGLKETRIESMAKSIMSTGGIMEPVEVEPLAEGSSNGHTYRLTAGFIRLAAITQLNREGAGLKVPAIVHKNTDAGERLRRQLAENVERESLSPMDTAVAVKRLLDMGVSRMDVREVFARPGGKKGMKNQPASNSFLNMHLSFLKFKKGTQQLIHDGILTVSGAYELSKHPDKEDTIIEAAKEARNAEIEKEEKEDQKIAEAQAKADKAEKDKLEAQDALSKAKDAETAAIEELEALKNVSNEAFKTKNDAKPTDRAALEKAFKAAEAKVSEAAAKATAATKEREGVERRQKAATELSAKRMEALRIAREGHQKKMAAQKISSGDVQTAAKATGSSEYVALTAKEIRQVITDMSTLVDIPEKVRKVGKALLSCLNGEITDKELYKVMERIVK